jgi:metallopeptidase MepB
MIVFQVALAEAETAMDIVTEPLIFYKNVSTSQELRDASNEADAVVRDFAVEASMRLDVFRAKTAAEANIKASGEWDSLGPEERRLVDKMILDGKRAGLALPESDREELTQLKKDLSKVCLDFNVRFS